MNKVKETKICSKIRRQCFVSQIRKCKNKGNKSEMKEDSMKVKEDNKVADS